MISAVVTGNIGKDASVREHDGKTVVSFSVASRRYERGVEQTDWVDVSFWGARARGLALHLKKGGRVCARGTILVREYEYNGQRRTSLSLRADDVELLGGKPQERGDSALDTAAASKSSYDESESEIPF